MNEGGYEESAGGVDRKAAYEQRRGWSLHCSPGLILDRLGVGVIGAECSACGERTMRYPSGIGGVPARAGRVTPDWAAGFEARGGVGWVDTRVLLEWIERHSEHTQARIAEWRASGNKLVEKSQDVVEVESVAPRDLVMNSIWNAVHAGLATGDFRTIAPEVFKALEGSFKAAYGAGQDSQWRFNDLRGEGGKKETFFEWWVRG